MSGVSVIRYLLANNAPVIAQVPAARIYAGAAPLNTTLPLITVTGISGVPQNTVAMDESGRIQTDRVQVSVLAATYASQVTIMRLVRTALAHQSGTINSVTVDAIVPDSEGPDLFDADAVIYQGSRDMMVRWILP